MAGVVVYHAQLEVEVSGVKRQADLPAAARRYIDRLSELLALPISIVSVGPDRDQTIHLR